MTSLTNPLQACSVSSVTAISEGQTYKQADESTAHNGTGTSGTFTSPTQKSVSSPSTGEDFSPNNNKSNNILLAEVVNIASDHIQEPAPASINLEELIRKNPNRPLKDVVSDLLHKVAEEEGAEGTRKLLRTLPPRVWDLFQNQFPVSRASISLGLSSIPSLRGPVPSSLLSAIISPSLFISSPRCSNAQHADR